MHHPLTESSSARICARVPSFLPRFLAASLLLAGACSAETTGADSGTTGTTGGTGTGLTEGGATSTTGMPVQANAGTTGTTTGGTTDSTGSEPPMVDGGNCAVISREAPEAMGGGVDVVFLLDTSGSMLHAITQVQQNLANFIQEFEGTPADTKVVMITGADPAANSAVAGDASKYLFLESEVDSAQLFSVALNQFPQYQGFLRPGAATQFVMITDDDDAVAPAEFRAQMEGLLGHGFTQHAIASEDVMGAPCISELGAMNNPLCMAVIPGLGGIPALCGAVAIGRSYYTLADQTGGKTMSICKGDWSSVFAELKSAVIDAVPLPCDYPLESASDPRFDPEQVKIEYRNEAGTEEFPRAPNEGACGDNRAWFYDDPMNPTTIRLCPQACGAVEQGGSVDVAFGCPPIILI